MLATDRPYFRRLNDFLFPQDKQDVYLTNTHEGLPPSGGNVDLSLSTLFTLSLTYEDKLSVLYVLKTKKAWIRDGSD